MIVSSPLKVQISRLMAAVGRKQLLLTSLLLTACAQSPVDNRLPVEVVMDETVAQMAEAPSKPQAAPLPDAVSDALLGTGLEAGGEAAKAEERFDLAVRDVPAQSFFLGLVEGTGVNVVVHPEVSGTITLDLKDVTVADVLAVARDIYGYEYKLNRGIYTIYPSKLRTEIFHINYLDVQRLGMSDTSVSVSRIDTADGGENQTTNGPREFWDNEESEGTPAGSRVQTFNKTDFWNSLRHTIAAIIGGEQANRMVMVTPQAGMVVVKALPSELNAVREFLERSELSVKRQVILEAKILEVRLNSDFEAGINWGEISGQLLYAENLADGFALSAAQNALVNESRATFSNNPFIDADGNLSNLVLDGSEEVGGTFAALLQVTDITKLLSLLETQGSVQVLSSPRISTVNNQKAVIRVGSDEFFVTGIKTNTIASAATTTTSPDIELTPFFSGIALDVTPQIADNGDVVLHIHPVVSDVQDQQKNLTVGDEAFSLPLALRDIRESDSIVRAKNGQVVVLGGLMQETTLKEDGKRPFLGDIPLVNTLFKTKNESSVKTELVILLRPLVVDDNVWRKTVTEHQRQIRRLGDQHRQTFGDG